MQQLPQPAAICRQAIRAGAQVEFELRSGVALLIERDDFSDKFIEADRLRLRFGSWA